MKLNLYGVCISSSNCFVFCAEFQMRCFATGGSEDTSTCRSVISVQAEEMNLALNLSVSFSTDVNLFIQTNQVKISSWMQPIEVEYSFFYF